jgi:hypothetical protein
MKEAIDVREIPTVISDSGQIRIGSASPAFPPARGRPTNRTEEVRIGSVSPAFPPVRGRPTNRTEKVRIGSVSPAFPPER